MSEKRGHIYQIEESTGKLIRTRIFKFMDEIFTPSNNLSLYDIINILKILKNCDLLFKEIDENINNEFVLDTYWFGEYHADMVETQYKLGHLKTITKEEIKGAILEKKKLLESSKNIIIDDSITENENIFNDQNKIIIDFDVCTISVDDGYILYVYNKVVVRSNDTDELYDIQLDNLKQGYKIKISYITMNPDTEKGLSDQLNEVLGGDSEYKFKPYILLEFVKE